MLQQFTIALPVAGGICFVVGLQRVFARAGVDMWVGMADIMKMSPQDKRKRNSRLWDALMDPAHRKDLMLVAGGFGFGMVSMGVLHLWLPLLAASSV